MSISSNMKSVRKIFKLMDKNRVDRDNQHYHITGVAAPCRGCYDLGREDLRSFYNLLGRAITDGEDITQLSYNEFEGNKNGKPLPNQYKTRFMIDLDFESPIEEHQNKPESLYTEELISGIIHDTREIFKSRGGYKKGQMDCAVMTKPLRQDGWRYKNGVHLKFMNIEVCGDVGDQIIEELKIKYSAVDRASLKNRLIYGMSKGNGMTYKVSRIDLDTGGSITDLDSYFGFKNSEQYFPRIFCKRALFDIRCNDRDSPLYDGRRDEGWFFPSGEDVHAKHLKYIKPVVDIRRRIVIEDDSMEDMSDNEAVDRLKCYLKTYRPPTIDGDSWRKGLFYIKMRMGDERGKAIAKQWSMDAYDDENEFDEDIFNIEYDKIRCDHKPYKMEEKKDSYFLEDFKHPRFIKKNEKTSPDYISLLNEYNTVIIRQNMGGGKTENLDQVMDSEKRIVYVCCKRSLGLQTVRNFGFESYDEIKEHWIDDSHRHVSVQVDSLHRIIGKVDLFILDEWIDLKSQLVGSKMFMMNQEALVHFIRESTQLIVLDANLKYGDRNYIMDIREKKDDVMIYNEFKFHQDKKIFICQKGLLYDQIVESVGSCWMVTDSKDIAYEMYDVYIKSHPDAKVLLRTGDSTEEERREKLEDYDCVISSPTITAGVSIVKKVDNVFGYYRGRSITAESGSQQLMRYRNWNVAYIHFDYNPEYHPVESVELDDYIDRKMSIRVMRRKNDDFNYGYTIDRSTGGIVKDDVYTLLRDHTKLVHQSRNYFQSIFLSIMDNHGIVCESLIERDENNKIIPYPVNGEIRSDLVSKGNDRKMIELEEIWDCKPTDKEIKLFNNGSWDKLNSIVYKRLEMENVFGCDMKFEFVRDYHDKVQQYRNLVDSLYPDRNEWDITSYDPNKQRIKNRRDRIKVCNQLINMYGFSNALDSSKQKYEAAKTVYDYVRDNYNHIETIFDIPKIKAPRNDDGIRYVERDLRDDSRVSKLINHLLNSTLGVRVCITKDRFPKLKVINNAWKYDGFNFQDFKTERDKHIPESPGTE